MRSKKSRVRSNPAGRDQAFPHGLFAGLLTAAMLTLVGVFLGFEPHVVLIRATVSALIVGSTLSVGMAVVRLANVEQKEQGSN